MPDLIESFGPIALEMNLHVPTGVITVICHLEECESKTANIFPCGHYSCAIEFIDSHTEMHFELQEMQRQSDE